MQKRVYTWLHPESDPSGDGYQALQSLYAIGSGGLTGLGYGNSRQKYLYLPEPQNDFIFSVFCEEMGWIAAIIVLGIFAFAYVLPYLTTTLPV
jgi:cell division protein FtsW